jgi:hypothetical protein
MDKFKNEKRGTLYGQSNEKVGELWVWGISLGPY